MRVGLLVSCVLFTLACSGPVRPETPQPSGMGRLPSLPAHTCSQARAASHLAPTEQFSACHTDADCTEGHNGRCLSMHNDGPHGPSMEGTTCSYDQCFRDADCGARQTCVCATRATNEPGVGHVCATGDCDHDADCGAGRYCRRGPYGKYCHSPADHCVEETQCGDEQQCIRNPASGLYECAHTGSIVG